MKEWIKNINKKKLIEKKMYSQSYQDSLIDYIFKNIGTSINPYCVEFGYDRETITKDNLGNCTNLILNKNWNYLLLDGANENPDINLRKHFLTSKNICKIFKKYNVPQEPDYISIDVDSSDLWLFDALIKKYKARLFSVEHNVNFPINRAITKIESPDSWICDRAYGASLKALNIVAENNGYSLIWVVNDLDAFFVRNDLIHDESGRLTFPLKKWAKLTNKLFHAPVKDKSRINYFLDYEVFINTNGDLKKSIDAAKEICTRVLLKNRFRELKKHHIPLLFKSPKKSLKYLTYKIQNFFG